MKETILKYTSLIAISALSVYAYTFLHQQTGRLAATKAFDNFSQEERRVVIHDAKTNSKRLVIIAPPKGEFAKKKKKKEQYEEKNKNVLPDVEFLKFIIDKGKEGIPVLKFGGLLSFLND